MADFQGSTIQEDYIFFNVLNLNNCSNYIIVSM